MSNFASEYTAGAWGQIKATHGVTASYAPPSSSASTITGKTVVKHEQMQMSVTPMRGAGTVERIATIRCDPADIPQPLIGGRFTIGASHAAGYEYWTITGQPEKRAGIWSCPCSARREIRAGERNGGAQ
jgi:hypothetical protein